ncbi:uncharacterized protein LOC131298532 [Rhododendron vialii]|uniref:uncharacterized protein LOC131298532 n=1 Tax=Rhododendron vialii TaxID=182163 RepID=UPI00265EC9F1|nr:uncharacterized protein LOC131298532 [Rhododendron vialii]
MHATFEKSNVRHKYRRREAKCIIDTQVPNLLQKIFYDLLSYFTEILILPTLMLLLLNTTTTRIKVNLERNFYVAVALYGAERFQPSVSSLDAPSAKRAERRSEEDDHRQHPPHHRRLPQASPFTFGDHHQFHPPLPATTTSKKNLLGPTTTSPPAPFPTTKYEFPIYSAKAVRFRMRHPRSPIGIGSDSGDEFDAGNESTDSPFIWTYTSLEFPMAQEN